MEKGSIQNIFQLIDDFGNATLTYAPIPNGSIAGPLVILSYSDNIFGFALKAIGKGGKVVVKYGDDAARYLGKKAKSLGNVLFKYGDDAVKSGVKTTMNFAD